MGLPRSRPNSRLIGSSRLKSPKRRFPTPPGALPPGRPSSLRRRFFFLSLSTFCRSSANSSSRSRTRLLSPPNIRPSPARAPSIYLRIVLCGFVVGGSSVKRVSHLYQSLAGDLLVHFAVALCEHGAPVAGHALPEERFAMFGTLGASGRSLEAVDLHAAAD